MKNTRYLPPKNTMKRMIALGIKGLILVAIFSLAGCVGTPVGHEAAKFHGEQALRSMKNPTGHH